MAVNWPFVLMLDDWGFLRPGTRVLDIGTSNIYHLPADDVAALITRHNRRLPAADVRRLAERLAEGSGVGPDGVFTNRTWVGELFEAVGMEYHSFDVARMYKTEVFDLNRDRLPERHRGRFDLVLNFGTTEHVFNQLNAFEVIHDAVAPGGVVWHQLPSAGHVAHCYFTYHPRLFLDMARINGYELVRYWVSVGGSSGAFDGLGDYAADLPAVADFLYRWDTHPQPTECVQVPDVAVNALYRKAIDRPFRIPLETTTSAGRLPESVAAAYRRPAPPPSLLTRLRRLAGRAARRVLPTTRTNSR
jgi:SAM-dependent methyltransferase